MVVRDAGAGSVGSLGLGRRDLRLKDNIQERERERRERERERDKGNVKI